MFPLAKDLDPVLLENLTVEKDNSKWETPLPCSRFQNSGGNFSVTSGLWFRTFAFGLVYWLVVGSFTGSAGLEHQVLCRVLRADMSVL